MTPGAKDQRTDVDREIVLDIWHLSLGFARETPAGVDRVDTNFAAHFLNPEVANRKALLLTPLGPRAVRVAAALRILEALQKHWRETERPEADSVLARVRDALAGPAQSRRSPRKGFPRKAYRALRGGARGALLHDGTWTQ